MSSRYSMGYSIWCTWFGKPCACLELWRFVDMSSCQHEKPSAAAKSELGLCSCDSVSTECWEPRTQWRQLPGKAFKGLGKAKESTLISPGNIAQPILTQVFLFQIHPFIPCILMLWLTLSNQISQLPVTTSVLLVGATRRG
uniref:Uncharacterized protein n=1 Tax=Molossus molossus TaxID=27622 RepID=A0A7J8E334_MOLMO|nr:hypothetical protein HJG59_009024 [Molossus molossus]